MNVPLVSSKKRASAAKKTREKLDFKELSAPFPEKYENIIKILF
jgi:hypothetical protein